MGSTQARPGNGRYEDYDTPLDADGGPRGDFTPTAPVRSAGEHEWREIVVRIYPHGGAATVSVHTRRNRGSSVVWQRRLGVVGAVLPGADDRTARGVLTACIAALTGVRDRLPE